MATKKKLLQAAAGSAGGAGLNAEEVFSTYLYTGNGSTQTITNDIDLSGEGGLVWIKDRDSSSNSHMLYDTERGAYYAIKSNTTGANQFRSTGLTAFNSNGFTLGSLNAENGSGNDKASWTFRKAPKFFDVVTYTGNGSSPRTISHNLGTTVGHITVKPTSSTGSWWNFHRTLGAGKALSLNSTDAVLNSNNFWGGVEPTSTEFTVQFNNNASGVEYVAYLFAHNDGDGNFGPTGDQDIIKCGSYTGTGSAGLEIDLGFEPQWFLMKRTDTAGSDWFLFDVMRGFDASGNADRGLRPNTSDAESNVGPAFRPIANGVEVQGTFSSVNASGGTYIYIAIRRGPMAVPESATDVFDVEYSNQNSDGYYANLGAVTDTWLYRVKNTATNWMLRSRLTGANYLHTNLTNAETSQSFSAWDNMNGVGPTGVTATTDTNAYSWVWKRAPNFFDVVAYTGDGTYPSSRSLKHNLGVAPELMIYKNRSAAGQEWEVHLNVTGTDYLRAYLSTNLAAAGSGSSLPYGDYGATPDADNVYIRGGGFTVNNSGDDYIAYLFASLAGVSKVGSYTGNGSTQTIDCGFSSGARFVLIKRTDSTGDWYVWDTERGIVAANDPHLSLNTTAAEVTTDDSIDPVSSGFAVNQNTATNINVSSATYIFYAIA